MSLALKRDSLPRSSPRTTPNPSTSLRRLHVARTTLTDIRNASHTTLTINSTQKDYRPMEPAADVFRGGKDDNVDIVADRQRSNRRVSWKCDASNPRTDPWALQRARDLLDRNAFTEVTAYQHGRHVRPPCPGNGLMMIVAPPDR